MRKWRVERERAVSFTIQAEREALQYGPEVALLVEAQERDARTFNIKRSGLFVSAAEAERLFYGGVYPE